MLGNIHSGFLVNGSSKKSVNIEISPAGIVIGVIKKMGIPWSSLSDVAIYGPSSNTSRITATRLMALGVFALAARKSTSETLVIFTLQSGESVTVIFSKKTELQVRAIFAPYIGNI